MERGGLLAMDGSFSGNQDRGLQRQTSGASKNRRFWRRPRTVREALIAFLLAVLLPVVLVQAAIFYAWYREQRSAALQSDLELARAVGAAFDAFVRDVLHQELAIGLALSAVPSECGEACQEMLVASTREYPPIGHYSWVDRQGRIVASSEPRAVGRDISDRPPYREVAGGRDWAVSDLFLEQIDGQPAFAVIRGVRDPRGVLRGMVVAVVWAERLGSVLSVPRDRAGAIAIVDRQGRSVYRYPAVSLPWEQRDPLKAQPAVAGALAGYESTATQGSVVVGQSWIGAATPIRSIGWVASASQPLAGALAPLRESFLRILLLLLAGIAAGHLCAMVARRWLTRPIGRLRDHALAIGRGELTRRAVQSGPAELRDLAAAFNRMAEEIGRREEQREDILRMVSHDLRGPLTIIQGQAQLLLRALEKAGADGHQRLKAQAILASSQRMNAMIEDLVDSARLEAGTLRLAPRPVALRPLLLELKERLAGVLESERIRIQAPQDLPPIWADPNYLERILVNLLSNALKCSPSPSEVTLAVAHDGDQAVISVADRGPGIPPDELPHLFQRYFRTRLARERHWEGLGLGLYIVKMLVEVQGGRIWVQSEQGQGCTFSFTLPLTR